MNIFNIVLYTMYMYIKYIKDHTQTHTHNYLSFLWSRNSIAASAVCAYNLSAITQAFNGPFRSQENPRSTWLPTPNPISNFQVHLSPWMSLHFVLCVCVLKKQPIDKFYQPGTVRVIAQYQLGVPACMVIHSYCVLSYKMTWWEVWKFFVSLY